MDSLWNMAMRGELRGALPEFYDGAVDEDYDPHAQHLLFVYGTMKQGKRNHGRLVARGVVLEGKAWTVAADYQMLEKSGESGPAPVVLKGGQHRVLGEVYKVPGPILAVIDMCEGHPLVYERTRFRIEHENRFMPGTITTYCWGYLFVGDIDGMKHIQAGDAGLSW